MQVLSTGVIIALAIVLLVPGTSVQIAKSYFCFSTSGFSKTHAFTAVSGSSGGCSTSSSSTGASSGRASVGCDGPNCNDDTVYAGGTSTASASAGGGQSSCSQSSSTSNHVSSFAQSQKGKCP